jgi:peptidyl-prolyl cis-trans isomerase-like 2
MLLSPRHCPVTFKVFNDNTRIVAVRTSGYVYAMDAVQELNIKPRNWKDLMTDEPFTKEDLITLQDPDDEGLRARRDISNFTYLKEMRDENAAEQAATPASSNIRVAPGTAAIFKDIEVAREKKRQETAANNSKARAEEDLEIESIPDLASIRRLRPTMEDLNPGAKQTDSKASQR